MNELETPRIKLLPAAAPGLCLCCLDAQLCKYVFCGDGEGFYSSGRALSVVIPPRLGEEDGDRSVHCGMRHEEFFMLQGCFLEENFENKQMPLGF